MTRIEFRSDPKLVGELRELLEHPTMQLAKQVLLLDDGPLHKETDPDRLTESGASTILGHAKGFFDYPTQLKLMATHIEVAGGDADLVNDYDENPEED